MCQKLMIPVMKTELQPCCIIELPNAVVSDDFFYYLIPILTQPHPFSRTTPVHLKCCSMLCSYLILPSSKSIFLNHSFIFMFMNQHLHYFPFYFAGSSFSVPFHSPFSLQPLNAEVSVECSEPTFSPWMVSG